MKDIIWTLIVVWLIYKVVDVFRISAAKRSANTNPPAGQTTAHHTVRPDKDIKNALKKHLNKEGEYIDFEELK